MIVTHHHLSLSHDDPHNHHQPYERIDTRTMPLLESERVAEEAFMSTQRPRARSYEVPLVTLLLREGLGALLDVPVVDALNVLATSANEDVARAARTTMETWNTRAGAVERAVTPRAWFDDAERLSKRLRREFTDRDPLVMTIEHDTSLETQRATFTERFAVRKELARDWARALRTTADVAAHGGGVTYPWELAVATASAKLHDEAAGVVSLAEIENEASNVKKNYDDALPTDEDLKRDLKEKEGISETEYPTEFRDRLAEKKMERDHSKMSMDTARSIARIEQQRPPSREKILAEARTLQHEKTQQAAALYEPPNPFEAVTLRQFWTHAFHHVKRETEALWHPPLRVELDPTGRISESTFLAAERMASLEGRLRENAETVLGFVRTVDTTTRRFVNFMLTDFDRELKEYIGRTFDGLTTSNDQTAFLRAETVASPPPATTSSFQRFIREYLRTALASLSPDTVRRTLAPWGADISDDLVAMLDVDSDTARNKVPFEAVTALVRRGVEQLYVADAPTLSRKDLVTKYGLGANWRVASGGVAMGAAMRTSVTADAQPVLNPAKLEEVLASSPEALVRGNGLFRAYTFASSDAYFDFLADGVTVSSSSSFENHHSDERATTTAKTKYDVRAMASVVPVVTATWVDLAGRLQGASRSDVQAVRTALREFTNAYASWGQHRVVVVRGHRVARESQKLERMHALDVAELRRVFERFACERERRLVDGLVSYFDDEARDVVPWWRRAAFSAFVALMPDGEFRTLREVQADAPSIAPVDPFKPTDTDWLVTTLQTLCAAWDMDTSEKRRAYGTALLGLRLRKTMADIFQAQYPQYRPVDTRWFAQNGNCDIVLVGEHPSTFALEVGEHARHAHVVETLVDLRNARDRVDYWRAELARLRAEDAIPVGCTAATLAAHLRHGTRLAPSPPADVIPPTLRAAEKDVVATNVDPVEVAATAAAMGTPYLAPSVPTVASTRWLAMVLPNSALLEDDPSLVPGQLITGNGDPPASGRGALTMFTSSGNLTRFDLAEAALRKQLREDPSTNAASTMARHRAARVNSEANIARMRAFSEKFQRKWGDSD